VADVSSLHTKVRQRAHRVAILAVNDVVQRTRREHKFVNRTGYLTLSQQHGPVVQAGSTVRTYVEATAPYAKFVDQGTRGPYIIRPRRAKVLRFVQHGVVRYAKYVIHPGIRARHFFSKPMPQRWRVSLEEAVKRP